MLCVQNEQMANNEFNSKGRRFRHLLAELSYNKRILLYAVTVILPP